MSEHKPCPFCGSDGEDLRIGVDGEDEGGCYVYCDRCDAQGPRIEPPSGESWLTSWGYTAYAEATPDAIDAAWAAWDQRAETSDADRN
jgi:hypothetical protein